MNIQYFELNPIFKRKLADEYLLPLITKIIIMIIVMLFILNLVISGAYTGKSNETIINVGTFRSGSNGSLTLIQFKYTVTILFLLFSFLMTYLFMKNKRDIYKDAKFGKGIQEIVSITEIIHTPSMLIYKINSKNIFTITSDQNLKINQKLEIYYLAYSKRILEVKLI